MSGLDTWQRMNKDHEERFRVVREEMAILYNGSASAEE
jgi:hypothetical protein